MFSLFKKKQSSFSFPNGYFPIITDIHSHILPGIDDGSPDVDTSIKLIQGLMELGIKQSIATPHIIGDMYRNDATTISNALNLLRNALVEKGIDYKVNAAAEYMMDDYFLQLLEKKTPLLTLKDNIVLTEFSYAERPSNVQQMVFSIITEGYQPILAHPERYPYYHNDLKQYDKLKDLGFLLQVNLLSLTGYYGKPVAKTAAYIIKNDLASFTATDLHHHRHMQALHNPINKTIFAETFKGKTFNEEMFF
jgi:protein-tyrosine phosphatase